MLSCVLDADKEDKKKHKKKSKKKKHKGVGALGQRPCNEIHRISKPLPVYISNSSRALFAC